MIENIMLAIIILIGFLLSWAVSNLYKTCILVRMDILDMHRKLYEVDRRLDDECSFIFDKLLHLHLDLVASKSLTSREISHEKSEIFKQSREDKHLKDQKRQAENEWFDIKKKQLTR